MIDINQLNGLGLYFFFPEDNEAALKPPLSILIFIFFCLNVLLRLSHFQSDINIRVDGFSSISAGDAFTKKKVAGQNFYFNQWLILKRNRDLRMKQCDYLSRYGISYPETIIDNLTIEEVTSLTNRPLMKKINDKDIYFKKITLEQYEALKYVYEGNIKINSDNATYFFELNPKRTNRSNIEMGEVFRKQDLKINVVLKTAKILSTIALSMIWSTFTVSEASGGNGAEVAINLFSRLFSLAAGVFGGITSAVVRVNNLSDEIENKINVLNEFIFDLEHPTESGFVPKKYEELAKEEYDKQVEEDKKAIENLVTDEDIPSIDILRIKGGENDEA